MFLIKNVKQPTKKLFVVVPRGSDYTIVQLNSALGEPMGSWQRMADMMMMMMGGLYMNHLKLFRHLPIYDSWLGPRVVNRSDALFSNKVSNSLLSKDGHARASFGQLG